MSSRITSCPLPIVNESKITVWEKPFPVIGQGVIVFNANKEDPFAVCVQDKAGTDWISLDVHNKCVVFYMKKGKSVQPLSMVTTDRCGLEKGVKVSYWFSYDRDRLVLKYGKGYTMEQTTIMTYDFLKRKSPADEKRIRKELYHFFNAEVTKHAKLYETGNGAKQLQTATDTHTVNTEDEVEFHKHPFVHNMPPLVLDSSQVTLTTLDEGKFTNSASLPAPCQELFINVKGCELDDTGERYKLPLSDAIRYSMNTKGCFLFEKLKEKAMVFSLARQAYLRVTLGECNGKSPGVPYVLELWPAKHCSPIHNHGNASAVIKVLFGSIHVQIYNKQTTRADEIPLMEFGAKKGDIMFLDKDRYQTHKLVNITDDFCATIQSYTYDPDENINWPYFDYISE